jgi:hypothetical protein
VFVELLKTRDFLDDFRTKASRPVAFKLWKPLSDPVKVIQVLAHECELIRWRPCALHLGAYVCGVFCVCEAMTAHFHFPQRDETSRAANSSASA